MTASAIRASPSLGYLVREAVLILLWAYVLLVGGTINGLFTFRVQAASAALLTGLAGLWLGRRMWQRRPLPHTGLEWAALAFISAQLVTALLSQDVRRSLPLVAQSISYLVVFYGLFDLTRAGWPAELTEKALLIVGGIVIGLGGLELVQVFLRWLALVVGQRYAPDFQYRLYAPLGDANLIAACLVVLVPLAAARALATPSRMTRLLLGLWLAAALVIQAFTASRGGTLGLAAALGMLALLWVGVVSPATRERVLRLWSALRARPLALAGVALLAVLVVAALAARLLLVRSGATQAAAILARQEFWPAAVQAFQESPLWGKGPGTFPTEFMRANSVPPMRVFLHAHSVTLNTAAEGGLLGLGAALFVAGLIARSLWRARHKATLGARARWAATAAGWAGFLVHSQVDDHTRYLAVALPLAVMLACALAEESQGDEARGLHPVWLIVPGLAAAALAAYSLRAYALSEQAVEAAQGGDWAQAARRLDEAAAADPALAFYWEQAGYAYGRLAAQGDPSALGIAIDRLEKGRDLEPGYALTRANLAALYWQAGRQAEALAEMGRAVELAPLAAAFHLNLGMYAELLGHAERARAAYLTALDLSPSMAGSAFWTTTPLRQAASEEWQAGQPVAQSDLLDHARSLIAGGQLEAAEEVLAASWQQDRQQLPVYVGLAEVAWARGDLQAAERYLENALWVQTVQVRQQVEALLLAAEVAQARGQLDLALDRYQVVLTAVSEYGSLGWGSAGWTPHAFFVFQRRGLPVDVLPQVVRADFTPALGRRLLPLVALLEARGEAEAAAAAVRDLQKLELAGANLAPTP